MIITLHRSMHYIASAIIQTYKRLCENSVLHSIAGGRMIRWWLRNCQLIKCFEISFEWIPYTLKERHLHSPGICAKFGPKPSGHSFVRRVLRGNCNFLHSPPPVILDEALWGSRKEAEGTNQQAKYRVWWLTVTTNWRIPSLGIGIFLRGLATFKMNQRIF